MYEYKYMRSRPFEFLVIKTHEKQEHRHKAVVTSVDALKGSFFILLSVIYFPESLGRTLLFVHSNDFIIATC